MRRQADKKKMEKIRMRNKSGPKKGKTEIGYSKKIQNGREYTLFIISNPFSHVGFVTKWGDISSLVCNVTSNNCCLYMEAI
jgi:hypothetical protein